MTLESRLARFNRQNKYQLTFKLHRRVIFCFLKCGWIVPQKARECFSNIFCLLLIRYYALHMNETTKDKWNIYLASLSICRLPIQDNWYKRRRKTATRFRKEKNFCAWSLRIFFFIKVCGFEIKKGKKKKILALLYKPLLFLNIHKFVFTTGSFVLLCSLLTFR